MWIKYFLMVPVMLFVYLLSYLLSPFIAFLSVLIGKDTMPAPFHWFYTNDDTLDGGQHQLGWPKVSGLALVKQRILWICRNPGYGWAAYVFGFKEKGAVVIKEIGSNTGFDGSKSARWYCVKRAADGKTYFGYRRNIPYGNRYIKIWFGWDMSGPNDGVNNMFKCMFNPFLTV